MGRTYEQCLRLGFERKKINQILPDARFIDPKGNTYVLMECKTKSGIEYTQKIPIPESYPEEQPNLYIIKPNPLLMYNDQSSLNQLGSSHNYHTHSNGPDECVQICYSGCWHAGMTILGILWRGIIWMGCYSIHLKTGQTIEEILEQYKGREDEFLK